ncbi:hypothetical protein [Brevundimonas sp. GCM10030266]|uniref:hypothetical protein n=1 Tax=Brevundimonas sp. GCM10030266 TaxID=3273386 RepID=UPI003607DD1C
MLPLILALITDPTITEPLWVEPLPLVSQDDRLLSRQERTCTNPQLQYAAPGVAEALSDRVMANDLLYREGDTVRRYLLLERRIENCSVPISFSVRPFRVERERIAPITTDALPGAY